MLMGVELVGRGRARIGWHYFGLALLANGIFSGLGFAQDAGSLTRDAQLPAPAATVTEPALGLPVMPETAQRIGPFFAARSINITGNTLFPDSHFDALVSSVVGPSVSLGDLENLAAAIDRFYLANGFLARTVVPEQDVGSGRVRLHVVEAQMGEVSVKMPSEGVRFDANKARQIASEGQSVGEPLDIEELEDSMQVLSGMPGIAAEAQLVPSVTVEGSDVVVRMHNTELANNGVVIDNRGSRFSGRERLLYSLVLNSPFGHGEQLSGVAVLSEGTQILSLTASMPMSKRGARLAVTGSHLEYDLVDTLEADGSSDSLRIQLTQPQLFSSSLSTFESITVGFMHLHDYTLGIETSDKHIFTMAAESSGALPLTVKGLAASYRIGATLGTIDLSGNASSATADSNTAHTEDGFAKLNLAVDLHHSLTAERYLQVRANAQLAADNLDSSQKMSLGGMDGVRAYPTGEASGDHALLLQAELHHRANANTSIYGFADAGWVQLNDKTWSGWDNGNTDLDNSYKLTGFGVGLRWTPLPTLKFDAIVASRIGDNPGADTNGRDGNGRKNSQLGWLELSMTF